MLRGVIPPHVIPFHEDGSLDLKSLEKLISFWLDSGVHALATAVSNGEGPRLTDDERERVLKLVVDQVGGSVPVVAGVSSPSTKIMVRQLQAVEKLGADAALITPPYYFKPSRRGLKRHYLTLLESSGIPLVLYNVPKFVGYDLPIDLVEELAFNEKVIGIKDSSGSIGKITELIRRVKGKASVLAGTGDTFLPTLVQGGSGGIVAVAIFAPELMVEIYNSFVKGDLKRASELQTIATYLNEVIVKSSDQIGGTKEALRLRGLPGGYPRLPSVLPSEEESDKIGEALRLAGLI